MRSNQLKKSALLALILAVVFTGAYELSLRQQKAVPDYDDNPALWADKRATVDGPKDRTMVFIGSSRIKYDLDIPTWESATGIRAVQLAMVGSSPRHFLDDLADDTAFKGRLIVDVTESIFFGTAPRFNQSPDEGIAYYKNRTPAQKAGFVLNCWLESRFVFLNKDFFSLDALLKRVPVKDRTGVLPDRIFPFGFGLNQYNRQSKMSAEFLSDPVKTNAVKAIWEGVRKAAVGPPVHGGALDSIICSVKKAVDKIRYRGGEVIFTRTPSSGPFLAAENIVYPRSQYWEKLLSATGCQGIYFADYPAINHFICPEDSHLQPKDAIQFTGSLVEILKNNYHDL